jgi:hypothetical protein
MVEMGNAPGQVPSFAFGHYWYDYFDLKVWNSVIDAFLNDGAS